MLARNLPIYPCPQNCQNFPTHFAAGLNWAWYVLCYHMKRFELLSLETEDGKSPFEEWLDRLDPSIAGRVIRVMAYMASGNFGDTKTVGGGVWERRIHTGPGYRIYYGRYGNNLIVLLAGGSKKNQSSDIRKARKFWREYLNTQRGNSTCH